MTFKRGDDAVLQGSCFIIKEAVIVVRLYISIRYCVVIVQNLILFLGLYSLPVVKIVWN